MHIQKKTHIRLQDFLLFLYKKSVLEFLDTTTNFVNKISVYLFPFKNYKLKNVPRETYTGCSTTRGPWFTGCLKKTFTRCIWENKIHKFLKIVTLTNSCNAIGTKTNLTQLPVIPEVAHSFRILNRTPYIY